MYVQPMCMESMRGKSMTRHSSVPPASGVVQYSTRRRHSRSLYMPRIDYWPDRVLVEVFLFTLVNSSKGRLCCRLTEVAVSNIEQQGDGDADIEQLRHFAFRTTADAAAHQRSTTLTRPMLCCHRPRNIAPFNRVGLLSTVPRSMGPAGSRGGWAASRTLAIILKQLINELRGIQTAKTNPCAGEGLSL